jgi:hypothetical protein
MRGSDKLVLILALAVPLLVVTVGWPKFVEWAGGPPSAQPTPEVAGAAATQAVSARAAAATPRPTIGAPPTIAATTAAAPNAAGAATQVPAADPQTTTAANPQPAAANPQTAPNQPTPAVAGARAPVAGGQPDGAAVEPTQAVSTFYALVSQGQFDSAAALWTPRMRAQFPPRENIDQRFSRTQAIQVNRAEVLNQDQSRATVAVDLTESDAVAGRRRYVGNWHLVHGANGWLLDQPELQIAQ